MAANSPPSPTASQLPPIPPSPTRSYASTAHPPLSQYNLPLPPPPRPAHAVLTKADLEHSQAAYADVLASAKAYRLALAALSTAASTFGSALESCARLKEARAPALGPPLTASYMASDHHHLSTSATTGAGTCTADTLLAVAGLQHLVANHQHILSESVYRAFEVPLLHELDRWRAAVEDEGESYARAAAQQGREIRRLEKEGVKLQRQRKGRDVGALRAHLVELTGRLDGLTVLHAQHAGALLRESQEASGRIVEASCSLARAEVEIFESLARKGWTGGGLEDVLERGVDLFAAEVEETGGNAVVGGGGRDESGGTGGGGEGAKLFSILPPRSILADTSGTDTLRAGRETRSDSLLVDTDRYQSLAGAISTDQAPRGRDRDSDSVFSEPSRARNVRPFSPQPQPLRLNPEGLLGGLEEDSAAEESRPSGTTEHKSGRGDDDGCAVEDNGEDDDESHPWRNEGLRRDSASDKGQAQAGARLGSPQEEEESWTVADAGT